MRIRKHGGLVDVDQNGNVLLTPFNGKSILVNAGVYQGMGSYQPLGIDLEIAADAGSGTETNPKFLAGGMFNLLGANLTKDSNYLAGVIGAIAVTGAKASNYPVAAVMGVLFDGVQADSIVLADLDGDDGGSPTNARAAFGVSVNNNNAGSGCDYGLSLHAAANANYSGTPIGFTPLKADIEFSNQQQLRALTGAITANVTTTNAPIGSIGITSHATGRGKLFMSDGTKWQFAAVA